jgi:P-type E1-E2 ATPase
MSGRINTVCFDKTGTLTEDGMSLKGVSIIKNNSLTAGFITKIEELGNLNK